jgi:hypothetical protein
MASFKQHAAFGSWKGSLILGDRSRKAEAMGQLGRLTKPSDLPGKRVLSGYIKSAIALNDVSVTVARGSKRTVPASVRVPADLAAAFKKNTRAGTGKYMKR